MRPGAILAPGDVGLVTLDIGGDDLLPLLKKPPCAINPGGLACQGEVATALASFGPNYGYIVASLRGALTYDPAPLLVMTYYNPFSGTGSAYEPAVDLALLGLDGVIDCAAWGNPYNVGLNDLIACIGWDAGATVVDVYPDFAGRGARGAGRGALLTHIEEGDIHPNAAGHAVIAAAFRDELR